MNQTNSQKYKIKYYVSPFILFIAVFVGFYFRLKGLGKWPFALDEYYIIRSVQNIFKYGLPQFDAGGYYSRGVLYQYLIAALWSAGLKAEFASRIIPVFTNLLAFPALYMLGKKVSGKTLSLILLIYFSFSLWEIEFARFARMYSPFQAIFVWYLYNFYLLLFENKKSAYNWMLALSFVSIFVYEASIFLVIMNFLPLLWDFENKKFSIGNLTRIFSKTNFIKILTAIVIFLIAYLYLSFDFRTFNQTDLLPPELKDYFDNLPKLSKFRMPMVLLFTKSSGMLWLILKVLPALVIGLFIVYIFKDKNLTFENKFSLIAISFFALFNTYGLLIIFTVMFAMVNWLDIKTFNKKLILRIIAVIGFTVLFWTIYAVFNTSWYEYFPRGKFTSTLAALKILWKQFLNYPNFYEMFVIFRNTLPKFTYLSILILFAGIIIAISKGEDRTKKFNFLFFVFTLLIFLVTFINTFYFDTRYFFFVFPLFLLLVFGSLQSTINFFIRNKSLQTVIFVVVSLFVAIISEDIGYDHLVNIDTARINFRKGFTKAEKIHYYPRWDSRSPSELVNKESHSDDVIITNDQICDFYLNRLDYIYKNYKSNDFRIESVEGGKRERWTNAKLIYTYKDFVERLFGSPKTKWLIINKMWGIKELEKLGFFEKIGPHLYYKSIDELTFLYKIPPQDESAQKD